MRGAGGWSTANLTPPLLSGAYDGDPYLAFSADLSRSLLSSGWRCRAAGGEECAAENPPLGPGAPPAYRNLYLREGATYTPLITAASFPALPASPEDFHLAFEGASADLRHVFLRADSELYEWSEGAFEPIGPAPGTALAAPTGAVSENGSRVYLTQGGDLYLREGETTVLVSAEAEFQTATPSGALAFFTKAGALYRYEAESATSGAPLATGVQALLGVSATGADLYYVAADGLYLDLVGRIDSKGGGIRTTFAQVPDAPVSKFMLTMQGGRKSLLENSRDLCAHPARAAALFDAHNGKVRDLRPLVRASGCGGKAAKRGRG